MRLVAHSGILTLTWSNTHVTAKTMNTDQRISMKNSVIAVSLAALVAAPVFAQEATPETAPAEAAPQAQEQAEASQDAQRAGGNIDLGNADEPAAKPAAPEGPKTYIKATHGDWQLQCLKTGPDASNETCQMYQLLKDANGGAVAEASIFKLSNGGRAVAGGTFIVPLETMLTEKLTITVDTGKPRIYDYAFCNQVGCFARVGFTKEDVAAFKKGAKAKISLVPALAPTQKVEVEMSLTGFTAAYGEASSLKQ
jgi:invasion protein IalB